VNGEAVGRVLLAARDRRGAAHERARVPLEGLADGDLRPALVALVVREVVQRAPDRLARPVDPRSEARVAAGVVAELVRHDPAQAALGHELKQWEPDDHHAPAPPGPGHGGIDLEGGVDLVGRRHVQRPALLGDELDQPRLIVRP
jgi:hypothetical protein